MHRLSYNQLVSECRRTKGRLRLTNQSFLFRELERIHRDDLSRQPNDRIPITIFHLLLPSQQNRLENDLHRRDSFRIFTREGDGDECAEEGEVRPGGELEILEEGEEIFESIYDWRSAVLGGISVD